MKKLLLIARVLLSFAASASAAYYVTTCGVRVRARDMESFETPGQFDEYCQYLNRKYCGKGCSDEKEIELSPDGPHNDTYILK